MQHFQNLQFQRWTTDQKQRIMHRLSDVWKGGKWLMLPFFDLDCLSAGALGIFPLCQDPWVLETSSKQSCDFKNIQLSKRNDLIFIAEKHFSLLRGIYYPSTKTDTINITVTYGTDGFLNSNNMAADSAFTLTRPVGVYNRWRASTDAFITSSLWDVLQVLMYFHCWSHTNGHIRHFALFAFGG